MKYYQSDLLLKSKHGFFADKYNTKDNGIYLLPQRKNKISQTLNQVDYIPDRSKIAEKLELKSEMLIHLNQIHSSKIIKVETLSNFMPFDADGMITNIPEVGLCILTADCAPILLSDSKAGIVGAIHAGWRGALAGITVSTIQSMVDMGAERDQINACIGPCISQKNYEVGSDLKSMFTDNCKENENFFLKKGNEKFLFDLPNYLVDSLRKEKIQNIDLINACTYEEEKYFHSYRRSFHKNKKCQLRNTSVIKL